VVAIVKSRDLAGIRGFREAHVMRTRGGITEYGVIFPDARGQVPFPAASGGHGSPGVPSLRDPDSSGRDDPACHRTDTSESVAGCPRAGKYGGDHAGPATTWRT